MGRAIPGSGTIPVAIRLAATYGLIVAATLLVVAGVAYDLTRRQIATDVDARLQTVVGSFQRGALTHMRSADQLPRRARLWMAHQVLPPGEVVAIRSADGRVVSTPDRFDIGRLPGGSALLRSGHPGFSNLQEDGTPVRALAIPIRVDGRPAGVMVVATSTADARRSLAALLFGIGWATAFGVALATLLGLAAIRRILRPLRRISKGVENIQATGDLSRRVGGDGPMDEVGRLAEAFDGMLARLEQAFRAQRQFLSDASHELRTPITVARGRLELLQEDAPEDRETVGPVVEELDRMARTVESLLLLARLDEGMTLAPQPVEVELVLREALLRGMLLRPHDPRPEVSVDVEPGLSVLADPERLLEVVTNLIKNAIEHAGTGAKLRLAASSLESRVVLTVTDTGSGIAPEELPHVFERFYRGSAARNLTPTGGGLGLAISASLVEAMHGTMEADSRPDQGATFTITLPRAEQAVPTPSASAAEG